MASAAQQAAARPPAGEPQLAPGDRAPNFRLPDPQGQLVDFYGALNGEPGVLFFFDRHDRPGQRREMQEFARLQEEFRRVGGWLVLVNRDGLDANKDALAACGAGFPLLADPKGAITTGYLRPAGFVEGGTACFVVDANQRLVAVRGDVPYQAAWALERLRERPAPPEARQITGAAPVLTLPNVLDLATCRELIEIWHTKGHGEGVTRQVRFDGEVDALSDYKSRLDHVVRDTALENRLATLLTRRIGPELFKAFGASGLRWGTFKIVCYDSERGDRFLRHRDNTTAGTADRRFALTMNLNTDEYEGGELLFPEFGPHLYRPESGGAVVFSCSLLHEALPVTKGRRFALLNFLWKAQSTGERARTAPTVRAP